MDDAVLTEPVEMPDSEAGLDYSDYVVRVEDRRVQPPGHFLVQSLNLGVQASDALQLAGQHAAPAACRGVQGPWSLSDLDVAWMGLIADE